MHDGGEVRRKSGFWQRDSIMAARRAVIIRQAIFNDSAGFVSKS